jgi:putative ABC transport system permease protein
MTWLRRLWRRSELEDQLARELQFHLDHHTADLVASGLAPDEARRQARLALGGHEQVKEQCRDARGVRWLDDLWQDARYALRMLRRYPGFATVALLTLALGSGATTVMFTVIRGVLFKPMPFADPGTLMRVEEQTKGIVDYRWGDRWAFAYLNFVDCQRDVRSLDMFAFRYNGGTVSGSGDPEFVDGLQVSANLLPALGVTPIAGRALSSDEDRPGGPPVAIISSSLWQRRFGGAASAVGATLNFDAKPYTIVGVTPPGFNLRDADVLTPIAQNTRGFMRNRSAHPGINVWARLRPGASPAKAQAELDVLGGNLAAQYPDSNAGRGFVAEPLRPNVGGARSMLWLLLSAAFVVLLIACLNVGSLLLARAVSRDREVAMRVALGAGAGRLARQHLTESAVLGLSGGALGVGLAAFGIRPFVLVWPGGLPRAESVQLDWNILAFAIGLSLACSLIFGLAPVVRMPGRRLEQALRSGARTVTGSRSLHSGLVIAEIALAMVLLVSAGMLGRTLMRLSSTDPGVNVRNVLTARMAISPAVLEDPGRARAAWREALDRGRRIPGVRAIAMVDTVPMREGDNQLGYWTTQPEPPRAQKPLALANSVTPDYLEVMGLPLRRGRFFNDHDRLGSEPVAVLDEVMARRAFGNQDPIGKRLWTDLAPAPLVVIGIVGHVRHWGLAADDRAQVREQFYYPFAQVADSNVRRWSELMSIAVRTDVEPLGMVESLRHELRGPGSDQVLYEVRTLEQLADATVAEQRFLLVLFVTFAMLALALASIGIYGLLAHLTAQRVPEFGVRIALGATARDVVRLVLGQSVRMVVIGGLLGAAGAYAAGRLLERVVQGMSSIDLPTFAAMAAILGAAALVSSFVPARHASNVDALTALRDG